MPAKQRGAEGTDPARRLLTDRLGSKDLTVVAEQSDTTPDGRLLRRVYGAVTDLPNVTASVVVDAAGEPVDLAAAEGAAGRRLFVPDVGGRDVPRAERTPVTIEPTVNDLVLAECDHLDERITVTVPPSGAVPKADVYLLADTTGSMASVLDAVQAGASLIVGNEALKDFDVAYGVGNYRDFPVPAPNSYAFQHQQAPTTTLTDAQNAVNVWTADEGGDGPEGQLWALQQIATDPAIGWRPDAKRIVVWFGDAPGHDPVCAAISGAAADVTEVTATAALAAASITVVAVSTTTGFPAGLDDDPVQEPTDYGVCAAAGAVGQATRISGATGGSLTSGVDATVIVTTLVDLIEAAVTATGKVTLTPTGATAQFVTSITPDSFGPLAGDVEHVLAFDVVWDGVLGCTDEAQVFTGTIDVVADDVVVASKAVRVTVPACRLHHVVEMLCGVQVPSDDGSEERCTTVVPGRYATAVSIYNPGPCPAVIEKRFAPLLLNGKPIGREPEVRDAKPFAKIELRPGQATMDDCCALEEAVRLDHSAATLGVLDLVSDRPLVVTAVYTAGDPSGRAGASVHTRTVQPRRA
jgi:hypothetical protein